MVVCGGLALVISAVRERGPGSLEKPGTLVTTGLHGRSRNPMYVGFCVVQVGLAGATRNAWILASCPVSAGLLHQSILGEERWLHSTFGDEYDSYRASVPRYWRPPAGRLAIHTSGRGHRVNAEQQPAPGVGLVGGVGPAAADPRGGSLAAE